MGEYVGFSRAEMQNTLVNYISNDALMIYWHHKARQFTYLIAEDREDYRSELKRLKRAIKNGDIVSVSSGETISIGNESLFPVLVEFRGVQCPAYFLLSESCMGNFIDFTPYFFRT